MRRLWMFGLLLLIGCGPNTLTEEEYAEQSTALANEFLTVGEAINRAPMPEVKHLPREERLRTVGERVKSDAAKYKVVADKIRELQPPKKWETHRQVLLDTVDGTHRYMDAWGDAIIGGNRQSADAAGKALDSHLLTSMDNLVRVIEDIGADSTQFRQMRDDLKSETDKL